MQSPYAAVPRPGSVAPRRLSTLIDVVGGRVVGGATDPPLTGVTASSDRVRPGDLFVAIPGRSGHGARFAADAVRGGARAVLTDQAGVAVVAGLAAMVDTAVDVPALVVDDVRARVGPAAAEIYGRPADALAMLGVTGTSGKTTTTFLVRAGLRAAGVPSGLIGTVATFIGDEQVRTGFTTPEAPDLQALLAVMVEQGVRSVAMEVSSHALAMHRVDGMGFAVGAFTNLSQDHLDFHLDMADYFAAKSRLFDGRSRACLVVTDDAWGRALASAVGPAAVTVRTDGSPATWQAHDVVEDETGATRFRLIGPGVDLAAGCALPGRYNVANAVLAVAVLSAAGVAPAVAVPAVSTASVPGRMERVEAGQPFLAVVDYSHKPAAVEGALRALRPLTAGRLIVVLGCGGDRDRAKRAVMGAVAARGADLLVVTDDNPRSEDPGHIRRVMLDGALAVPGGPRGEVVEVADRADAIRLAVRRARPGDTVLVAGKGHETGQDVAGMVYPFDDRAELRAALSDPPA